MARRRTIIELFLFLGGVQMLELRYLELRYLGLLFLATRFRYQDSLVRTL